MKKKDMLAQEADLQTRMEKFNGELKDLLGKFELGLGAQATITPDGRIAAQAVIVSTRGAKKEPLSE
jgi:hypothetical protein